ncbi:MAG: helix-turn-helix transcriptional regulator [Candidatus Eremiobacteraeota bacterium]|nr:helix-turn-helix transcriptional regulator [Candidatus Eremiobacteraeota bacterium]
MRERSPKRAARITEMAAVFSLEHQIHRAMEEANVSSNELAARLGADKAVVSRDLSGGLSRAKFQRIVRVADALDCDVVPLMLPRDTRKRKQQLVKAFAELGGAQPSKTGRTTKRLP